MLKPYLATPATAITKASVARTTAYRKQCEVSQTLPSLARESRRQVIDSTLSAEEGEKDVVRNLRDTFENLGTDNYSRALKSALVHSAVGGSVTARGLCRMIGSGRKLTTKLANLKSVDAATQWRLSLRQAPRSSKLSDAVRKTVLSFYHRSDISRELPGTKHTILITDPVTREKNRVPKKILEDTLYQTYRKFRAEYEGIQVSQRFFETLRPRDIGFAKPHHRLVCCCVKHTNIDMGLRALNQLSSNAGYGRLFHNAHQFVDSTLCGDGRNLKCLLRQCDECGPESPFLLMPPLKCRFGCPAFRLSVVGCIV
jgi:translation initiation factor 2 beta subunit (eIF-2beta)/eIF-5